MPRSKAFAPIVTLVTWSVLPVTATVAPCDLTALNIIWGTDTQCSTMHGGWNYFNTVYAKATVTSSDSPTIVDITEYCTTPACVAIDKALHTAYPNDCNTDAGLLWADVFGSNICGSHSPSPSPSPSTSPAPSPSSSSCPIGQSEMSVEGNAHVFCITGKSCMGKTADGACPGPDATYLPYGSQCAQVRTGVYGCRAWADAAHTALAPNPDSLNCAADSAPVSVVGDKAYCVKEPVCVGKASTGNCPKKADGLAQDAVCTLLPTNVYGCTLAPAP